MVKLAHKKTSLYFETDLVYRGLPDMGSFNDNYSTYFRDLISEISEECEHRSVGHVPREVYHVITAITLAIAVALCLLSIAVLSKRIDALEAPAVNPYKTQVLFKI